jgi:hypothetical protein
VTKSGIEYSDVTELSKNLQRAADYAPRTVDTWLHRMVGPALVSEMQNRAPTKSGHLRNSIRQMDEPRKVTVGPFGVTYNQFIVEGTKPHLITPKKGDYLVFTGRNGRKVFVKQVQHPGTAPNPYMQLSAEAVMNRLLPRLTELTVRVMKTGNVD